MRLTSGNASLRCDYCKNVVVAKADDTGVQFLDEAQKLTCPTCAAALWGAILAEIQISACKQCHGLLVSMADFELLLEHMRALHAEGDLRPTAPRIAERAGVSLRTVWQQFTDMETLRRGGAGREAEAPG